MPDSSNVSPEAEDVLVDRLRAALTEARDAIRECLGCRFMHDQCDCGDTEACGVCHMVNRLALAAEAERRRVQ